HHRHAGPAIRSRRAPSSAARPRPVRRAPRLSPTPITHREVTMSQHIRARRIAALVGASALIIALAGCSTPSGTGGDPAEAAPGVTDDTVTIGTHTPLTGPAAAGYASISAAATAYFSYLNAQGGVHGREIEYIVKDDGYNPANTQTVVRELVQQDEVFAIVNGLGTAPHQ